MNSYKDDEMLEMLKQLFEMDITKKDLTQCKPEFIQKVYSLFLKDFGVSIEKLSQLPMNAPVTMHQFPEMYKQQIFPIQLSKCVKFYLNLIYGDAGLEFSPMDIFSPEWNRTKRFLTMFIEFYNHLSDNLPRFAEVEEDVEQKKKKLDNIKQQIISFKQKIRQKELQNAEAEIALEKVKKSLAAEQEELRKVQEIKTRYKGRLEGLKEVIQELFAKTKEAELQILEGRDRIEQLRSQVIDESQSVEYEEGNKKLAMHKESLEEMKNTLKDMRSTMKLQEEAEEIINKSLLPLIEEYKSEVKKNKDIATQLESCTKNSSLVNDAYNDLMRSVQMISETIKTLEEESFQLKKKKDRSVSGLRAEIDQLKITVSDIKRNNEEKDIVAADINAELQNVMEEDRMLAEQMKSFEKFVCNLFERTNNAFRKFCQDDLEKLKKM